MVEAFLLAALGAGITEERFWRCTPFVARTLIHESHRQAMERAMAMGWWSERFAREERLSSLKHYLDPIEEAVSDGDALIASFAMMHGLGVEEDASEPAEA